MVLQDNIPLGSMTLATDVVPSIAGLQVRHSTLTFSSLTQTMPEQVLADHWPIFCAYHVITGFDIGVLTFGHDALNAAYASGIPLNTGGLADVIFPGHTRASAFLGIRDTASRLYQGEVVGGIPTVGEVVIAIGFIKL